MAGSVSPATSTPSSGGPGLPALLSALAAPIGAALFFSFRLARSPAAPPGLHAWIEPPAPPGVLTVAALAALLPPVAVLGSARWRPAAVALSLPAGSLAMLAVGPLPSPLRALALVPSFLTGAGARPFPVSSVVEAAALLVASLAVTLALHRSAVESDSARAAVAHGSARFAGRRDLAAADLLSGEGVVLGSVRLRGREVPLTDRSSDHVLVVMTTGGGKTTGPIATTLLNTLDPTLVVDPKGELWQLTAGWRQERGHDVLRFDPNAGKDTCRWNPLAEVTKGEGEVAALSALADNLITYPAERHGETHWTASARSLLRCLALHVIYTHDEPSMAAIRELLNSRTDGLDKLFKDLATAEHDGEGKWGWTVGEEPTYTHPEVRRLASAFASTPNRERGSIVSTLNRFLDLWGDPRVAAATAASDWRLELLASRRPVTVYVTAPTSQLARLSPLLRALLALLTLRVTDDGGSFVDESRRPERRRLLVVVDEFAALGRIPILEDLLAFFRGYGVRVLLAVQDLAQLRRLYGPHQTFTATCRLHVAAATPDVSTRQEISRRLGESTFTYGKTSRSGRVLTRRSTHSRAEVRRPLLTEGEVGELAPDRLLVVKSGHPPVLAGKLPYWAHPTLAARAGELVEEDEG